MRPTWNSSVQRPADAPCVDREWRSVGEPYLRADALALKELTAADAQGGFAGAEDCPKLCRDAGRCCGGYW